MIPCLFEISPPTADGIVRRSSFPPKCLILYTASHDKMHCLHLYENNSSTHILPAPFHPILLYSAFRQRDKQTKVLTLLPVSFLCILFLVLNYIRTFVLCKYILERLFFPCISIDYTLHPLHQEVPFFFSHILFFCISFIHL